MVERYDTVIVHYINMQEYAKGLRKVTEIKDDDKRNETMLRYASIFVNKCTMETIQELKKPEFRKMDVSKIMPAFMNIQQGEDMELALDYIQNFCISKRASKSKTVHNMAFYFHSQLSNSEALLYFLEQEEQK